MEQPKTLSPWAPVPASQPNPVGIDGVLEGLTPPYVKSMDEAVDKVMEMKYGADGSALRQRGGLVEPLPQQGRRAGVRAKGTQIGAKQVQYVKDACNYLYETYGRFPAHVDAFYARGMWLQFSHLEMEYYDRFFDPTQYTRQAAHDGLWHP